MSSPIGVSKARFGGVGVIVGVSVGLVVALAVSVWVGFSNLVSFSSVDWTIAVVAKG